MNHQHKLLQLGVLLFLLGLLTGLGIPAMASPRLGLSGHLEGVMNGMFLILVGTIWPKVKLSQTLLSSTFWALVYGTYINWITVLLSAIWGAGGEMMPIAGGTLTGSAIQEGLIKFGLISLSLAMIFASITILIGLKGNPQTAE